MSARFASGVPSLHQPQRSAGEPSLAQARQAAAHARSTRGLNARTATPRCSRPARSSLRQLGRARRVAVHAEGMDRKSQRRAVCRRHLSVGHHAQRAADHFLGVVNNRPRGGPGRERPVWRVGAVGEAFRRDAKTGCLARGQELRARQAEEDERPVEGAHGAGDRVGQRAIAGRHVVERAMGLHMARAAPLPTPAIAASAPIW